MRSLAVVGKDAFMCNMADHGSEIARISSLSDLLAGRTVRSEETI